MLHLILLELSNLNCHVLLYWATFMYVAFYIVFYILESKGCNIQEIRSALHNSTRAFIHVTALVCIRTLGNEYNIVPVRPSSVEKALSQSYGRGFCLDREKIRDSSTHVFPTIIGSVVPCSPSLFRWLLGCTLPVSGLVTGASGRLHPLHSWRSWPS